jgi:choline dehydrogenase-like flavoprotein
MMIKLADAAEGIVHADGTVTKTLTSKDKETLESAKAQAIQIMQSAGVSGPFVDGMVHGGHLGGTVPLTKEDVASMHPAWLPRDLWVADLSLLPRSQGLPAMLTTMALSLRVARKIIQTKGEK